MTVMLLVLCLRLLLIFLGKVRKVVEQIFSIILHCCCLSFAELDSTEAAQSPEDEESCSYITEEECDGNEDSHSTHSEKTDVFQPALRFSAFSGVPPYLNFCLHDEKGYFTTLS